MEKLYCKVEYPSGAVRYRESHEWNYANPADGLWIVRHGGRSQTWVNDYVGPVDEIPEWLKTRASLETIKNEVIKRIGRNPISINDLLNTIFDVMAKPIESEGVEYF